MNNHSAFKFISSLCRQSYIQPSVVETKMRKHIELTDKYQDKLWTRIILERLMNANIGTNGVQNHALKQLKSMNQKNLQNKFIGIVQDNMKYKYNDAVENEEESRVQMTQAQIELKKFVKEHSVAGIEYKSYVDKLWKRNWNMKSRKCVEKVNKLKEKQDSDLARIVHNKTFESKRKDVEASPENMYNKEIEGKLLNRAMEVDEHDSVNNVNSNIGRFEMMTSKDCVNNDDFPEVIKVVKYKDEDMKASEIDNKPVNLGLAIIDKNVEKVLSKPPKEALYKSVRKIDVELSIEEAFVKLNWNRNNNKDLEVNSVVNVDKSLKEKADFCDMRATSMKYNKKSTFCRKQ